MAARLFLVCRCCVHFFYPGFSPRDFNTPTVLRSLLAVLWNGLRHVYSVQIVEGGAQCSGLP